MFQRNLVANARPRGLKFMHVTAKNPSKEWLDGGVGQKSDAEERAEFKVFQRNNVASRPRVKKSAC